MGRIFTFGKWRGWNTDDLAQTFAGRGYLSWCAENLKSPVWRAECARALQENKEIDIGLAAKAEMHAYPHDFEDEVDAMVHVEDMLAMQREAEAEQAEWEAEERAIWERVHTVFARWAEQTGRPESDLRRAAGMMWRERELATGDWDWNDVPSSRFSSSEAKENTIAMMRELEEAGYHSWL